jgi:hypothetical protein
MLMNIAKQEAHGSHHSPESYWPTLKYFHSYRIKWKYFEVGQYDSGE